MLQPLYIFIIFVLKRNVINMILGRDKKGQKSKTRSERVRIRGKVYKKEVRKQSETNPPTLLTRLSSKHEPEIEMQSFNRK